MRNTMVGGAACAHNYKVSAMKAVLFLALLAALLGSSLAGYSRTVSYEGEIVAKCSFTEKTRRDDFLQLDEYLYLDVWRMGEDGSLDARMNGKDFARVQRHFPECHVIVEDVEELVRAAENSMLTERVNASWFEEYHKYQAIVDWYRELATSYGPNLVEYVKSIGQSVEGRDMPAVHIARKPDKPKMYFQCQIHAREWISGATCMYIANYLLENYGKNQTVTTIVDAFEFIFVPFANPDGYAYTWSNDRLWRKNRRRVSGSSCYGVDLNRNYNDHWGQGGSSSNPCSETYMGSSAESEPETQNTVNYFRGNAPIIGAIDWHSYSQLILRPYGWTNSNSPDEAQFKAIGTKMAEDIVKVHGKTYSSIRIVDLYLATGGASDWFYSEDASRTNQGYRAAGITIELRDTGAYGFQLPPDQIIPNGEEMIPAVIEYSQALIENPMKYN